MRAYVVSFVGFPRVILSILKSSTIQFISECCFLMRQIMKNPPKESLPITFYCLNSFRIAYRGNIIQLLNRPYKWGELHQKERTSKQLLQLHVQPPSTWERIKDSHISVHQLLPHSRSNLHEEGLPAHKSEISLLSIHLQFILV